MAHAFRKWPQNRDVARMLRGLRRMGCGRTRRRADHLVRPVWAELEHLTMANTMTIRDALEALNAWAESTKATHIHYGIESLKRGARAILEAPSTLNLDAPIRNPAASSYVCPNCGLGTLNAFIDYGDLGRGHGGPS